MDATGRHIETLIEKGNHAEGSFQVNFDPSGLMPGTYFYVMENTKGRIVKRLIILE